MTVKSTPHHRRTVRGGQVHDLPMRVMRELAHRTSENPPSEAISSHLAEILLEMMVQRTDGIEEVVNDPEIQHRFIESVLRDPSLSEADILRRGRLFGIDFTRPRAVILVGAADYILRDHRDVDPDMEEARVSEARIKRRAQFVIQCIVSYFSLPRDTICAHLGDGEIAILKASSSQDLAGWVEQPDQPDWGTTSWANLRALKRASTGLLATLKRETKSEIAIGIGRYHPGIRGLTHSYEDARAALSLGLQFKGPNQVHCLDQLGIASFVGVADERTKFDLSAHLLSPLDHAQELTDTLEVFFEENCCPSSTASRLEIHRNTLRYRLDKITSLIGLDPRIFDHAVQIRLALVVQRLNQAHR